VGGVAALAAFLLAALLAAVMLHRRRRPRPLGRILLAGAVKAARDR
jgi:hypothetical protein